jgi:hypothetical protein
MNLCANCGKPARRAAVVCRDHLPDDAGEVADKIEKLRRSRRHTSRARSHASMITNNGLAPSSASRAQSSACRSSSRLACDETTTWRLEVTRVK